VARTKEGFRRFFRELEETGLKLPLRRILEAHGSDFYAVYMDAPGPATTSARVEIWWYLTSQTHRSTAEVAMLFDRNHASVAHALRLLREKAEECTVSVAPDTVRVLARMIGWKRRGSAS
jgi:hypothetical protein